MSYGHRGPLTENTPGMWTVVKVEGLSYTLQGSSTVATGHIVERGIFHPALTTFVSGGDPVSDHICLFVLQRELHGIFPE